MLRVLTLLIQIKVLSCKTNSAATVTPDFAVGEIVLCDLCEIREEA